MKRLLVIVVATLLALVGFTYFSQSKAGENDTNAANGADMMNIPLTKRQVQTAGIGFGKAEYRDIDATLTANGQIILRAKDKGNVASLMDGIVRSIYVTDGQYVRKGQTVAMVENTDVVSLQREYYSASKDCEFARLDMQRQQTLNNGGAGIKRNLQEAERQYHIALAKMQGIAQQLAQMGISTASALRGRFITTFPVRVADVAERTDDWDTAGRGYKGLWRRPRHADKYRFTSLPVPFMCFSERLYNLFANFAENLVRCQLYKYKETNNELD